jgi:hypothetical protein
VVANRGLPEPAITQFIERLTSYPWLVVGTVFIGAFVGQLDASIVQLGLFVWRESEAPAPLIDLRLFESAAFSAGCVGVLISYTMLYGMFFAMSFTLIRGYHDPAFAAGLRLTVIPAALGLVAPFDGAGADKRPRLVMACGMAICPASALALTELLTGTPDRLTGLMAALAACGARLGLYIAPNNNATIGAAPGEKSGVAGGLPNLPRVFGAGVADSAGVRVACGDRRRGSRGANSDAALLSAVGVSLTMIAIFAALAAAATLVRSNADRRPESRSPRLLARRSVAAADGAPREENLMIDRTAPSGAPGLFKACGKASMRIPVILAVAAFALAGCQSVNASGPASQRSVYTDYNQYNPIEYGQTSGFYAGR